jgi:flagellar basal-body rod protein FlgF
MCSNGTVKFLKRSGLIPGFLASENWLLRPYRLSGAPSPLKNTGNIFLIVRAFDWIAGKEFRPDKQPLFIKDKMICDYNKIRMKSFGTCNPAIMVRILLVPLSSNTILATEKKMINGMLESSRGCIKEELRMDIISNNLANSTGIGFKKDRISFQQMLDENGQSTTPQTQPTSEGLPADPCLVTITVDMSGGDIQSTGNQLDLAISGDGFFKISTPDGVRYTRKGNFTLDSAGTLVTQDGYPVMGKGGNITITGNNVAIGDQGTISVDGTNIGQLDMVTFEDTNNLNKDEKNLFRNDSDKPEVAVSDELNVKQGYVELANVNVAEEMVNMIHSMRAFESYQKAMKAIDELNGKAINDVGVLR